ncbi:MAG: ATP-binding cassette domain-containing protein [Acidimicrobiales bacterium]|nr:ATP-binding cassette domain-containing protein [Acidimicrobiales bacterium]
MNPPNATLTPPAPKQSSASTTPPRLSTPTVGSPEQAGAAAPDRPSPGRSVFEVEDLSVYYGDYRAVREVNLDIRRNEIAAFIGPSGCGKSTVLRCFNRMNDVIPGARVEGDLRYHGIDVYGPKVEPVEVRRRIGMVFQKPNPFSK